MISFTWLHWTTFILISMVATVLFILIFRLKGQLRFVAFFILVLATMMAFFTGTFSLDKMTKKATLSHVKNKRILRTEEIVFKGYIKNIGKYKIGKSELELKLINGGKSLGRVKGSDFYRTNSIFGDLFSSKSDKKKSRPSTIVYNAIVAKELMPGERRLFVVRFKFPSYFKDVDFRLKLFNDLAETTIRSR